MKRVEFLGRTLPLRLRNLAEREAAHQQTWITIRSMKCGRGCEHGRAFIWDRKIRLYLAMTVRDAYILGARTVKEMSVAAFDNDLNRFLLIHELAHLAASSGHHDLPFYREAIRIAKRERCLRGWLNWQGRNAKAAYRRLKAA